MAAADDGTFALFPTPFPTLLFCEMPPSDTWPVMVKTRLRLATEVMITSPFLLRFNGASPAITAAAESDKVVPRDARLEPCMDRPAITCTTWIARPKSITMQNRTSIRAAMRANSSAAWPDSAAATLLHTEPQGRKCFMTLPPTTWYCREEKVHF